MIAPLSVRRPLTVLALTFALGLLAAGARAADTELFQFRVLLDGKAIGEHSFRVSRTAGKEIVDIKADFDVTFFAIPVYSYDHASREVWDRGCLDKIAARTDDNGDTYEVDGEARGATFSVSTGKQAHVVNASCVMTFAYWNPAFLKQQLLLNAQTGAYVPVDISFEGSESLTLDGESHPVLRYRLRNDAEDIDLSVWYDQATGKWLSLESRVSGGKVIRYVPVATPLSEPGAMPATRRGTSDAAGRVATRSAADDPAASR